MQNHPTQPRPATDNAVALIEVLADYFKTFDHNAYASVPSSLQSVMSMLDVLSSEIGRSGKIYTGSVDWLVSRVADLASEGRRSSKNHRSSDISEPERRALFNDGVRLTEISTLSRGLI